MSWVCCYMAVVLQNRRYKLEDPEFKASLFLIAGSGSQSQPGLLGVSCELATIYNRAYFRKSAFQIAAGALPARSLSLCGRLLGQRYFRGGMLSPTGQVTISLSPAAGPSCRFWAAGISAATGRGKQST